MGRKAEQRNMEVKIPTLFRCPISLDVMKSPVSLCTGVTYDRSSIQRWLDCGNATCPATMQPLPSTELVPNLTLQRLIQLWSSSSAAAAANDPIAAPGLFRDLLRDVRSSPDPVPSLRRLAGFFSDVNVDDFAKNSIISAGGCAATLASLLTKEGATLEELEAAIGVLALILTADCVEEGNKRIAVSSLVSDLERSVSVLIDVLTMGSCLESRIDAVWVLDGLLSTTSDADSRVSIAQKADLLLPGLIRLIRPCDEDGRMDRRGIEAGLACLTAVASISRRARARMVRLGAVPALARVLAEDAAVVPAEAAERALRLMEAASGCAEGREAICEAAERCIGAVLGRMMKVGREGTESAVVVLWSVCHLFRDRRAQETVAAASGGLTKILLLMQSGCSPAVRQMAGDLLKIFHVNSKSCLSRYDTKTSHIMPF